MTSIVYSITFFNEINSDWSFYVQEDYQHDLLYWLLYLDLYHWVSALYCHHDIKNNNTDELYRFWYERVYFFLPSALGETRREIQLIRTYATYTMLTPPHPHAWRILKCLWSQLITAGRDPNWFDLIRSEKPNHSLRQLNLNFCLFKILKFSWHLFWAWRHLPTQFMACPVTFPV